MRTAPTHRPATPTERWLAPARRPAVAAALALLAALAVLGTAAADVALALGSWGVQ